MTCGRAAAIPALADIEATAALIAPHINRTPVCCWRGREIDAAVPAGTTIYLKLELFQQAGSFKVRGVLSNLLALTDEQRARGVTAMSAGNHAVAVAWGARRMGISAKVVMLATANPARIAAARALDAEIIVAPDGTAGFSLAERIAAEEGRAFIHPFDGYRTALGTATLGLELTEQVPDLDAVFVAIGGGGLAGGVARAVKLLNPRCQIFGVEPEGAASMHKSFLSGSAQRLEQVQTIADSLAPPMTLPYSYSLCRDHVDHLITVSDDAICRAMALLFREMKLAVEPAGAASTAGLLYCFPAELRGRRVGVIICGSNIDIGTFSMLVRRTHSQPCP